MKITIDHDLALSPLEMAVEFGARTDDYQADFFNALAEQTKAWNDPAAQWLMIAKHLDGKPGGEIIRQIADHLGDMAHPDKYHCRLCGRVRGGP